MLDMSRKKILEGCRTSQTVRAVCPQQHSEIAILTGIQSVQGLEMERQALLAGPITRVCVRHDPPDAWSRTHVSPRTCPRSVLLCQGFFQTTSPGCILTFMHHSDEGSAPWVGVDLGNAPMV
jgi:hypothetical protein